MEVFWITLKVCLSVILVGTALYLGRQHVAILWRRSLQQKFFPVPFTPDDAALAALSLGCAVLVLVVISFSDPFVSGILYVGSVQLATLALAIVRIRYRSFYTLLFTATIYLGFIVRAIAGPKKLDQTWDWDSIIVFGVFLVFLVILPTAIAWVVTLFRKGK